MIRFDRAQLVSLDPEPPRARPLLVRDGRIVAAADDRSPEVRGPRGGDRGGGGERVVDCGGSYLYPAFHDAHLHLNQTGLALARVGLGDIRSRAELFDRIRGALDEPRTEPALVGEGADESEWEERRFPTRDELDRVSTETPIIVRHVGLHRAAANSPALRLFGENDPNIDVATGQLVEGAAFRLDADILAPSPESREAAIVRGARVALSRGVSSVEEISSWPTVVAAMGMAERGRLPLRMTIHILYEEMERARRLGLRSGNRIGSQGRLTIGGIKLFADGAFSSRTAALREPYADRPSTRGMLLLNADAIAERVRRIEDAGFRAIVHVIGDAALDAVLGGFEAAGIEPGNPRGHRLEHVELLPDERSVARLEALGLGVAAQPNFVGRWGHAGGMYESRLGRERARLVGRLGTLRAANVPFALSSDAMPIDPLFGIRSAVSHPVEAERLDALEAFRRYTRWGGGLAADPHGSGTLTPGAPADFVLLPGPPEEMAAREDAAVVATILDGEVVYERRRAGDEAVA